MAKSWQVEKYNTTIKSKTVAQQYIPYGGYY